MTKDTVTTGLGELGPVRLDPSKASHANTKLHRAMSLEASFLQSMGETRDAGFIRRALYSINEASAARIVRDMQDHRV